MTAELVRQNLLFLLDMIISLLTGIRAVKMEGRLAFPTNYMITSAYLLVRVIALWTHSHIALLMELLHGLQPLFHVTTLTLFCFFELLLQEEDAVWLLRMAS